MQMFDLFLRTAAIRCMSIVLLMVIYEMFARRRFEDLQTAGVSIYCAACADHVPGRGCAESR